MKDFDNAVSGTILYKGISFSFFFDRHELRLIPPQDSRDTVHDWLWPEISPGIRTSGRGLQIDEPYLIGHCDEGNPIILFPYEGSTLGAINDVLIVQIHAYIWFNSTLQKIGRIEFQSPELDTIYPIDDAVSVRKRTSEGGLEFATKPAHLLSSDEQEFSVSGINAKMHFAISSFIGFGPLIPPVSLHSVMCFEFEETDDYTFILRQYHVARCFVQYLCYRRSTPFSSVVLNSHFDDTRYIECAYLHILNDTTVTEEQCLRERRCISHHLLNNCEGKILTDIDKGLLYTRNIPLTYEHGRSIDAARFVMITAAFEWEYRRLFPTGIPKKESTVKAEELATALLTAILEKSSGKLRDIIKSMLKNVSGSSLAMRIEHTGTQLSPIIHNFGKQLYGMNNTELKYHEMGQRLGKQRNNFAHGNLDQDFVGTALLDLLYLEMVVYAMQLKYYGVSDTNIKHALNELFHKNQMIRDDEESFTS